MEKEYDLNRFVKAQSLTYSHALSEIRGGRKRMHWMWFIFPQLKALGRSSTALYYGIESTDEARLYIEHEILGARLREISSALLTLDTCDPEEVFGSIDALKLCSCMTLFAAVSRDSQVFLDVLNKFFGGRRDSCTLALIEKENT